MRYTKQDCIESLQEADSKVSGTLSRNDYRSLDISPSYSVIKDRLGGSWNDAKRAAGLELFQRSGCRTSPPEYRDFTREEWENLSASARTREKRKSKLGKIKVDKGCKHCGYDKNPAALQFHHKDKSEKNIPSHGSMAQVKESQLDNEIEKCIVLCANCHMVEHNDDGRYDL